MTIDNYCDMCLNFNGKGVSTFPPRNLLTPFVYSLRIQHDYVTKRLSTGVRSESSGDRVPKTALPLGDRQTHAQYAAGGCGAISQSIGCWRTLAVSASTDASNKACGSFWLATTLKVGANPRGCPSKSRVDTGALPLQIVHNSYRIAISEMRFFCSDWGITNCFTVADFKTFGWGKWYGGDVVCSTNWEFVNGRGEKCERT